MIGGNANVVNNVTCGTGTAMTFTTADCQPFLTCESQYCRCIGPNATAQDGSHTAGHDVHHG